ncbi:MAG: helicase-exonuclease AddAB subunit AddA [Eubacteriales bacterium]|jgi:ATP-dependent helicase/nuclease subunit A|nr:helicase-exonuclease AddAB subunit AddA [Bacillota bacterium]MBV1728296.1 helicase-exonuclease AddAB subunit AddA [Desulforudis sp.]MDP3049942.1 helicase-exonuclease AddAB subunit AddA [Eubacteriales bacterium]MBU4533844.1 helicase-exonuclease AddAB subunit AddA [Bacillota bacterium]MBU4555187.1 helicase-exonuclease AddAB subunit AddA [Bacillota bacterium]
MGDKRWTKEQLQAIETRGQNLLVSAAAGAGKTAVLVERAIRMVTDEVRPVDINRILVVTFTNAAAAEMRHRIATALQQTAAGSSVSPGIVRQLGLLEQSSITTLHSFCLETVRRYFHLIGLDPSFRVGDENELALLRLDVLTGLFETQYGSADTSAPFASLADTYGGEKGDLDLQDLVLRLYDFARSTPWPHQWLHQALGLWEHAEGQGLDDVFWVDDLRREITAQIRVAQTCLLQSAAIAGQADGPGVYLPFLQSEVEYAGVLLQAGRTSWLEMYHRFQELSFGTLKACRDGDEELKEQVKTLRNKAKKILLDLQNAFFQRPSEDWLQDVHRVRPLLESLVNLTIRFEEAFSAAKRGRGLVDFSDLEHFCLRILNAGRPDELVPSPVAEEYRRCFDEVMVDEYQDINAVQETILQLVSRQGDRRSNLFMVGDVKQSIYRFRLAEPGLFLEKYHTYPSAAGRGPDRRLDLATNFRSTRVVVDAVNYVFAQIMRPETGEIAYDEAAALRYGADYPAAVASRTGSETTELYIIDHSSPVPESDSGIEPGGENALEEETGGRLDTPELEAALVAARIMDLVHGSHDSLPTLVYDRKTGTHRPVTYSDIVVLLRTTKNWANTFVEVFLQHGIPVYADLGSGYFAATEVETLLSLLTVIDNPHQDIPLAGVLRSPLFGFTASDLAALRLARSGGDFFGSVRAAADTEGFLAGRVQSFLEQLEEWRTLARRAPLPELIWQIYRDTGYYEFVGGLPGGIQRQANLRALHDRARQYEQTSYRGLFRFLRFINRIREKGDDLGTARTLGEKEDVVRVLSVHRSKGLEFPVTIVAGLGKQFNLQDGTRDFLLHRHLGFSPDVIDPIRRLRYPTLLKHCTRYRLRREALAEEMRVLYVAMTRARERLILVGSSKNLAKSAKAWCEGLPRPTWPLEDADVVGARSFLDWIGRAVVRHPDGAPIRKLGRCSEPNCDAVVDHPSRWLVQVTSATQPSGSTVSEQRPFTPQPDSPDATLVHRRLAWTYPSYSETLIPVKLTATELKRRMDPVFTEGAVQSQRPQALTARPRFLQRDAVLTGAERGTALHLVLQHLDLNTRLDEQDVGVQISGMVLRGIITSEQAEAVDGQAIARFFASPLGYRVRGAALVSREMPFTLRLPASRLYPGISEESTSLVLIQGVIDCLLDETGGYVIVDYKSDRFPPGDEQAAFARYGTQLALYTEAVEVLTGRTVTDRFLYFFANDSTFRI